MKPIFLVGYMGSGKTTLGRAISKILSMEFIDLDIFIEARYHHTIKEVFAEHGEDGFRQIEKSVLHEVAQFEDVIVACGGGTPCHFDNMDFMNEHGFTVFLDVPIPRLVERLTLPGCKSKRPIVADKTDEELSDFIRTNLAFRSEYYKKSAITFDASQLEDSKQIEYSAKLLTRIILIHYPRP